MQPRDPPFPHQAMLSLALYSSPQPHLGPPCLLQLPHPYLCLPLLAPTFPHPAGPFFHRPHLGFNTPLTPERISLCQPASHSCFSLDKRQHLGYSASVKGTSCNSKVDPFSHPICSEDFKWAQSQGLLHTPSKLGHPLPARFSGKANLLRR